MDWRNDWQSPDPEGLFLGDSRISTGKVEAGGEALPGGANMVSGQGTLGTLGPIGPVTPRWANSRLQDRESVERELLHSGCTHVSLGCLGVAGGCYRETPDP